MRRRKYERFSEDDKAAMLSLSKEGLRSKEIQTHLPHLPTQRISGFLRMHKAPGANPNPRSTVLVRTTAEAAPQVRAAAAAAASGNVQASSNPLPFAAQPTTAAHHQSQPSAEYDFRPTQTPMVTSGGIPVSSGQGQRLEVERIIPQDGLLGVHPMSFLKDDIGRVYGSGTYRITTRSNSGQIMTAEVPIAATYGPPLSPKRYSGREGQPDRSQPKLWNDPQDQQYRFERAEALRASHSPAEDLKNTVQATKELMTLAKENGQDSSGGYARAMETLAAAASQPKSQESGVLEKWFIADAERRSIERKESEERRERERREDMERRDRDRKDDQTRFDQIMELDRQRAVSSNKEKDDAHKREMERLKEENSARVAWEAEQRKTLLELEAKKIELVTKAQEAREKELDRRIEEVKAEAESGRDSIQGELEKERDHQTAMFDLRSKQLDIQEKFQNEKLDMQRQQITSSSADSVLWGTVKDLVDKGSKAFERYTETEQLKMVVEEAKKNGVSPGTVADLGRAAMAGNMQPEAKHTSTGQASNTNGNGNGKGAEVGLLDRFFKDPIFAEVVEEWGLAVSVKAKPSTFANTFLVWMNDPENTTYKKATSTFALFLENRDWPSMFEAMQRNLSAKITEPFKSPYAAEFYEAFRVIVVESTRYLYAEFMQQRADQEARVAQEAAANNGSSEPVAEESSQPLKETERIRA